MEQEKLMNILKNKTFTEKIIKLKTPEEVQSVFQENGVEISIEEVKLLGSIINQLIESENTKPTDENLEKIAGGGKKLQAFARGIITTGADFAIDAAIIATIIGVDYTVSWAYKKGKEIWNYHNNTK